MSQRQRVRKYLPFHSCLFIFLFVINSLIGIEFLFFSASCCSPRSFASSLSRFILVQQGEYCNKEKEFNGKKNCLEKSKRNFFFKYVYSLYMSV